jgi:hypothetical protein
MAWRSQSAVERGASQPTAEAFAAIAILEAAPVAVAERIIAAVQRIGDGGIDTALDHLTPQRFLALLPTLAECGISPLHRPAGGLRMHVDRVIAERPDLVAANLATSYELARHLIDNLDTSAAVRALAAADPAIVVGLFASRMSRGPDKRIMSLVTRMPPQAALAILAADTAVGTALLAGMQPTSAGLILAIGPVADLSTLVSASDPHVIGRALAHVVDGGRVEEILCLLDTHEATLARHALDSQRRLQQPQATTHLSGHSQQFVAGTITVHNHDSGDTASR